MIDNTDLIARLRVTTFSNNRQKFIETADALQSAQAEIDTLKYEVGAIAEIKAERDQALERLAEVERQEPVGYVYTIHGVGQGALSDKTLDVGTPLFAAAGASPVQPSQAGLSDEEILRHWARRDKCLHGRNAVIWFARAVIRAAINAKEST